MYIANVNFDNEKTSYFLWVDVKYPYLYEKHHHLPFLVGKVKIKKVEKVAANYYYIKYYVVHISTLQQALNYGLIFAKVHQIISFKQEKWLKPYILLNTKLRAGAKNNFEKNLYKLMNNYFYGKTIENKRKHCDIMHQ